MILIFDAVLFQALKYTIKIQYDFAFHRFQGFDRSAQALE